MSKVKNRIVAALDIGSTKVVCFIARIDMQSNLEVIGIGHQISEGIRFGTITDIKAAERSILGAVASAEKMAGENVDKVIVNISGDKLQSHLLETQVPISGNEITDRDIFKVIQKGKAQFQAENKQVIHTIPVAYSIDETHGIQDPKAMFGDTLGVTLSLITTSPNTLLNLSNCLARCHLDVEDYLASPYASGIACLTEDEKQLGVILLDIGGGNTSISAFKYGRLLYTQTIPVGGQHVTKDIACGLSTTISDAERIKILYGNTIATEADDREVIDVTQIGEEEGEVNHVPRSHLVKIIRPRIEENLELVKESLHQRNIESMGLKHIVITGGASQLIGLKELATHVFKKQVRIGLPKNIEGLAESTKGAAFSCCAGMLFYAIEKQLHSHYAVNDNERFSGYFGKMFQWVRENF